MGNQCWDFKNNREKASGLESSKKIQKKKKGRLVDSAEKRKMQDMWEEMYKSVEKSKNRNSVKTESSMNDIEGKLKVIKNLHAQGKISDTEYKKRKRKLLGHF